MRRAALLLGLALLRGCNPAPALAQTAPDPALPAPYVVLVCVPVQSGASPTPSCGNDANNQPLMASTVAGYILSAADYSQLRLASAPFDYGTASSLFGFGVFLVLVGYVMAYPLGLVLRMLLNP